MSRCLAADCPLLQHLGFNHVSSVFVFSTFVAFTLNFTVHVVANTALGFSSNSMHYFIQTAFAVGELKFNPIPTSLNREGLAGT